MSNLRAFVKEAEQLIEENNELRRRLQGAQAQAVLNFFQVSTFTPDAEEAVRQAIAEDRVSFGYVVGDDESTQCYIRVSGPANSMHKSKIAASLADFEAICLELAAQAGKEGGHEY
jgi:hypothetical protein